MELGEFLGEEKVFLRDFKEECVVKTAENSPIQRGEEVVGRIPQIE